MKIEINVEEGSEDKIYSMYSYVNLADQKTLPIKAGMTLNDNKVDFEVDTGAVLTVKSQISAN